MIQQNYLALKVRVSPVPEERSIDIDTQLDLDWAEFLSRSV